MIQGGPVGDAPVTGKVRFGVRRIAPFVPIAGLAVMVGLTVAGAFNAPPHPRSDAAANAPQVTIEIARRTPPTNLIQPQNPAPAAADAGAAPRAADGVRIDPAATSESTPKPDLGIAPAALPPVPAILPKSAPGVGMIAAGPAAATGPVPQPIVNHAEGGPEIPLMPAPPRALDSPGNPSLLPAAIRPPAARRPAQAQTAMAVPRAKEPWRTYAQPFDASDKRPRIALIVAGTDDDMAWPIDNFPPQVTLALDPYARRLPEWIEVARAKGHEVLLTLSMPPLDGGKRDAGPVAILSSLDPKENLERLDWALARTTGFVGVLDIVARRGADEARPILATLASHGLMLVDTEAQTESPVGLPRADSDLVLMPDPTRDGIEKKLATLEEKARRDGSAVAIALNTPSVTRRVAVWANGLAKKSIALAPATALAAAKQNTVARE